MTYLRRVLQSMGWLLAALVLFAVPAAAQNAPTKPKFDVYGFAQLDFGFQVDPAPPRSPRKKGKVEAGVRYVRHNFLATCDAADMPAASPPITISRRTICIAPCLYPLSARTLDTFVR